MTVSRFASLFCRLCCLGVGIVSVVVIMGWVWHSDTLIRIVPAFAPMQFNTAALLGLSAFAAYYDTRYRQLSLTLATVALVFAALTLAEYALDMSCGIDTLILTPFTTINVDHPGRMAPNTAFAFLFTGAALFISAAGRQVRHSAMLAVTMLCGIVMALAVMPLIGKIAGTEVANLIWGSSGHTAEHTAMAFLALGACIAVQTCRRNRNALLWLPVPVFLGFVVIAVALSTAARISKNIDFDATLETAAQSIAHKAQIQLDDVYNALDRISSRWAAAGGTAQNLWEADAAAYLKGYPFLTALSRTDTDTRVIWLMPKDSAAKVMGFKLNSEPVRGEAIARSLATRASATTPVLKLLSGDMGFLYVSPLFSDGRNDGVQVGAFKLSTLFGLALDQQEVKQFYVTIEDDARQRLYTNNEAEHAGLTGAQRAIITNKDFVWTVSVTPTAEFLAAKSSFLPTAILLVGLLTALLMTLCSYLAIKWHTQNTARQQLLATLAQAEELKRKIIDSSGYMFIAVGVDGAAHTFNRKAELLLGYRADEIIGKYSPVVWHLDEEINARAAALTAKLRRPVIAGFEVFSAMPLLDGSEEQEWTFVHKDGRRFPVLLTVTVLQDANAGLSGFLFAAKDITQEKASVREQKKLIAIIESSSDFIGVCSLDGIIEYLNPSACLLLGLPQGTAAAGRKIAEFHPPSVIALIYEQVMPVLLKTGCWQGETVLLHSDGREIQVLQGITLHRDDRGEPAFLTTIIRDITAQKQEAENRRLAEANLRRSEERLYLAASGTSDGLWDWNVVTDEVYYSPRFMMDLGYAEYELPYNLETFYKLLHPDDADRTAKAIAADHAHETPYNIEYRLLHKSGYYVWINARGQTVWDENDRPIRMTGFTTNIDKRKKAQDAFQKAHDELNLIFNNVNARIWYKDDKNNIIRLNNAAAATMGGTVADFENRNTKELFPAIAEKYLQDDLEVIGSGKPKLGIIEQYIPANGTAGWSSTDKVPYYDKTLDTKGVFVISTDISELKNAEQQLEQLVAQLTESNTELGRFAYVASHDMQEPLRMIANFGELLSKEYADKLDDDGRQYVQIVAQSALRMQQMVNDLLEYARIGNDAARFVRADLAEEFRHVRENLSTVIRESGAAITHNALPVVKGNPVQLMRLLQNLVANGLKYQAPGNAPQLHIGVREERDYWEFAVQDNGIGMDPKYAEQVFEPFKRLHSWQEYNGSGIGLAVCKKIVENHGGKIWLTSTPGVGSVFRFTLPKNLSGAP